MSKLIKLYRFFRYNLLQRNFYGLTAPFRVLPNFIVIGVGRGGTTALFHYLGQHNCITKSAYDEIGYFDDNYHLGLHWYRSMFPTIFYKQKIIKKYGKFLTFEVTPWYIRRPWTAKRIHEILPNIKLIVILRNPVDRTYSHYHLSKRESGVTKSFDEVIGDDMNNLSKFSQKNNKFIDSYFQTLVQNSYLARGFYVEQLEQWFEIFNKKQLLVISSEDLANKTQSTLDTVFKFLDVPQEKINDLKKINVAKYPPMSNSTRKKLLEYFQIYNEKLFKLLNCRFEWEK